MKFARYAANIPQAASGMIPSICCSNASSKLPCAQTSGAPPVQRDCTRAIFLASVSYLAVFEERNVVSSHINLLYSFRSLISPGLRPYSLSEGVAIGNATTCGGHIGEGTRCGGFGC